MRNATTATKQVAMRWRAALVPAALCAFACSMSGTTSPGRFESFEGEDASGFTITQDLGVSSQVRSDFKKAMRLLEKEDYDGAIVLLEKVTEAAPHVTTAHIERNVARPDLGIGKRSGRVVPVERDVDRSDRRWPTFDLRDLVCDALG